ncbi:MAG: hypothetical protein J5647_05845 [Spirochaetaceae bacterium]|nr:hypothetical protein [Spirochaetaceae bacterium]
MEALEETVKKYRNGDITLKQAADKVMEIIFKNPRYFYMGNMPEDCKSEFILRVYTKLEHIIETYDPSKSLFRTYLVFSMQPIRRSLYKSYFQNMAENKAYEEYAAEECSMCAAEEDIEYGENLKQLDRNTIPENVRIYLTSCLPKMPDATKIMMLALKSEHFITSEHISKLHNVTGINEDKILDMFLKLRGTLYKRKKSYHHHKELQNKSYILKKRSMFLLETVEKKSNLYEIIENSKRFQNETWKKQMEKIKSIRTITPTNSEVARILGISGDQIRRLQKFIEGFSSFPQKKKKG